MAWLLVFSTHFLGEELGAALAHKKNWLEIREKCTHVELLKFFPEEIDGRVGGNFYKLDLTQKASVAYICNDFGPQFISWELHKNLPQIVSSDFHLNINNDFPHSNIFYLSGFLFC